MQKQEKMKDLILGYLKKNPNAYDTVEGIADWWIYENEINVIEEVIHDMVANKVMAARKIGGEVLFGLGRIPF